MQNAASGYGEEGEDAGLETADVKAPSFDIPTTESDAGSPDLDAGMVPVETDVGSSELDAGPIVRLDIPTLRDLGVVPIDRGAPIDLGASTGACASLTSCASCTAASTCGWCALTARCYDGAASGPTGGATCALGWAWVATACTSVDPCTAAATCGTCAARAGCGWCGASSRCVTANTATTGPAAGTCASAWAGAVGACTTAPPDPCAVHTDCESCGSALQCGWCRSSRRCMTGTGTGPTPLYGTCDSWAYLPSACTALPTDACRTSSSCGGCVGRGACGWCRDSNTCHTGSSSGPTDRACRGSRWYWDPLFGICLSP